MKFRAFLCLAVLSLAASGFGYLVPCQGQLVAEAEYLYFVPLVEDSAYVVQADASGLPQERNFNTFNGHSGVRVTGKYGLEACSNNHISGSWTYVWRQDRDRTVSAQTDLFYVKWISAFPDPTDPFTGSVISRLKVKYNDGDLVLNHHLVQECLFDLYLIGGLQFMDLSYREDINIVSQSNAGNQYNLSQTCDRRGVGLKTGLDVLFGLPCWLDCLGDFKIHAKATGALLISRNDVVVRGTETVGADSSLRMQNEKIDTVLAAMEMKLGLNYGTCLFGKTFAAELGYNIIYYPRAIDQVRFTDQGNDGISFDNYTGFGLHGLFIGAGMRF